MNKTELMSILKEMVKNELTLLLKSKEGRVLLREIISRDVRVEVDRLLTEMESSHEPKDVIQETQTKRSRVNGMVERGELPPKRTERTPPIPFTKNSKINAMLNQTLDSIRRGEAQLPSTLGVEGQAALLKEQYATGASVSSVSPTTEGGVKSVVSMLPDKDVNGNPLMVNPGALPDHIQNALTRDYRKVMKKVDEKRG